VTLRHPAGFPTHVIRHGRGRRRALMLHCSLAHSGAWSGLAARLGQQLSMTAFDLPGHGRSGDWDGTADLHALSTAIAGVLAAELAGPAAPVELIGHSFGATVALRLALERPGLVRGLTLIEPVLFAAARDAAPEVFAATATAFAPVYALCAKGEHAAAARAFLRIWGNGQRWDDLPPAQRAYATRRIAMIPATDAALSQDAAGLLRPGRLEALDRPVLLISGGSSPPIIAAIACELTRRLPQARSATVPGAGHMVPITHPGPVAEAILDFLPPPSG
jgi:lipase